MAENLLDLRRRIKSVRNTQKSTRAMKTVSAAKLRRAVGELKRVQPIMERLIQLLKRVGRGLDPAAYPLMEHREDGVTVLVVVSADKGLCGPYNSHINQKAETLLKDMEERGEPFRLITVGNKATQYFTRRSYPILTSYRNFISKLKYENSLSFSGYLQDLYLDPEQQVKEITFVSTHYISSSRQEIENTRIFPISDSWEDDEPERPVDEDTIFEPSKKAIFDYLLPKYLNSYGYELLLQSSAAEHAARMVAMELATNNASEMIRTLTLTMNKLRQASITNELLEIITATEALNN